MSTTVPTPASEAPMISQGDEVSPSMPKTSVISRKATTMPKSTVWLMASLVSAMPRSSKKLPRSAPLMAIRQPMMAAVFCGERRKAFSSSRVKTLSSRSISARSSEIIIAGHPDGFPAPRSQRPARVHGYPVANPPEAWAAPVRQHAVDTYPKAANCAAPVAPARRQSA